MDLEKQSEQFYYVNSLDITLLTEECQDLVKANDVTNCTLSSDL